jgi:uroporphyrinogen III methyltransferase/synthase
VENFHARFNLPELVRKFPKIKIASIGPETSKAIQQLGLERTIEPREHTIDALVQALSKDAAKVASL